MNEIERQQKEEKIFQDIWNGRATAEQLKAKCTSDAEKQIIDEISERVERTDRDFLEGFRSEMGK